MKASFTAPGFGNKFRDWCNEAGLPHRSAHGCRKAGAKIAATPDLDLLGAYYHYKQNSFATGAEAGCSSTVNAKCSGTENVFSLVADYRFAKRFDGYLGTMWTGVQDGLANGFLNKSTLTTTTGIRFKF